MQRFLIRVSGAVLLTALVVPAHAGPIFGKKKSGKKPDTSNPLSGLDSKQPDKELYDKAMNALKKGHYDVCRLDLQTLLNTYPDSEYQMRAKLGIGDSWFKEGGSAAYTQAESDEANQRYGANCGPHAAPITLTRRGSTPAKRSTSRPVVAEMASTWSAARSSCRRAR